MNDERMWILANEIENPTKLKVRFGMEDFITHGNGKVNAAVKKDCGTAACIAGHACLLFGQSGDDIGEKLAMSLLGLTQDQANRLFYNTDGYVSKGAFSDITREEAANAIRYMIRHEG